MADEFLNVSLELFDDDLEESFIYDLGNPEFLEALLLSLLTKL